MRVQRSLLTFQAFVVLGLGVASSGAVRAQEEIRVKHLLVATEAEATKIREEIVANGGTGKAFTNACRVHSKDPTTKKIGGDLGWFRRSSSYDPVFKEAAFALKDGETSKAVKSEFGWHLIHLVKRRDRSRPAANSPSPAAAGDDDHSGHNHGPGDGHDHDGHDHSGHDHSGHDHSDGDAKSRPQAKQPQNQLVPDPPPATGAASASSTAVAESLPIAVDRSSRQAKKVVITLESTHARGRGLQLLGFRPGQAVELNVYMKNAGSEPIDVFDVSLIPLGLEVTQVPSGQKVASDFSGMAKPSNLMTKMSQYEIRGTEISLQDYFPDLESGRYEATWSKDALFANLEKRFPEIGSLPNYPTSKATLLQTSNLRADGIASNILPQMGYSSKVNFYIFDVISRTGSYYANIHLVGQDEPIVVELDVQTSLRAARHFAYLALDGFYDNLEFDTVEKGSFILGGSPTQSGNGTPNMQLPRLRNTAKLKHERGTVSFVSRSIRKGPVQGGEIGSIFFVSLKAHPEWDEQHVPFGKIVSGLEALDGLSRRARISAVVVTTDRPSTSDEAPAVTTTPPAERATQPAERATQQPGAEGVPGRTTGNPEVVITTSKGDITVELHEHQARNTVRNFVRLSLDGYYDKDSAGSGKQKFFMHMKDGDKGLLIQAGSPTNDVEGGPGYAIRSEPNDGKHVRGSLSMVQKFLNDEGRFAPDSAGSQFFICLDDLPYYDTLGLTVFGKVTKGLDLLDKLTEGDTIESVKVTKMKGHPYNVSKVQ